MHYCKRLLTSCKHAGARGCEVFFSCGGRLAVPHPKRGLLGARGHAGTYARPPTHLQPFWRIFLTRRCNYTILRFEAVKTKNCVKICIYEKKAVPLQQILKPWLKYFFSISY